MRFISYRLRTRAIETGANYPMRRIGVGIVGASPLSPGWAVAAHIPALKALPEYDLRALSTSRRDSADAAGRAFGISATFDNHHELILHPGVDLVVVAVKVPNHHQIVAAALEAGKMVFCEWPLGKDLAEAANLSELADTRRVRTAIGLQARFAPAIRHARDLIANGYIGEVFATTLVGSGIGWGPTTDRSHVYMYDEKNGATTLSVPVFHALDALIFILGDLLNVEARLAVRQQEIHVVDEGSNVIVTAPDQIAIIGGLRSGAVASIFYRGGVSRGNNLRWEINGSEGDLVLTAPNGNVQVADLKLEGGRGAEKTVSEIAIPPHYSDLIANVPAGPPSNVGQIYAHLARDIREGTHTVPDFAHALEHHRLLDAIQTQGCPAALLH
jgi:predicted dehydrogenase